MKFDNIQQIFSEFFNHIYPCIDLLKMITRDRSHPERVPKHACFIDFINTDKQILDFYRF